METRVVKGAIWGFISFSIQVLQAFLLVPLMLKYWGNEEYGLWIAINGLFSIIRMLDAGHHSYIGNKICQYFFSSRKKLKITLASAILVSAIIGTFQLAITTIFITTHLFSNAIGVSGVETKVFSYKIAFLIINVAWLIYGSIGGIIIKLYAPSGQYHRGILWGIAIQLAQISGILIVILSGGGITFTLIVSNLLQLVVSLIVCYDIYRKFNYLNPLLTFANLNFGFSNFIKSLGLTIAGVISQFQTNGVILFISYALGAGLVPIFSTMRTLTNVFYQFGGFIIQPLAPELIRYHGKKNYLKIINSFSAFWLVTGVSINIALAITLPIIGYFYRAWTANLLEFDISLYMLLAFAVALKVFGTPITIFFTGLNHIKYQLIVSITQLGISFIPLVLLIDKLNLHIIGWFLLVGEFIGSICIPYFYFYFEISNYKRPFFIRKFCLALSSTLILGFIFLAIAVNFISLLIGSVIGIILTVMAGFLQWRYLNLEIKNRIFYIIYKAMGIKNVYNK